MERVRSGITKLLFSPVSRLVFGLGWVVLAGLALVKGELRDAAICAVVATVYVGSYRIFKRRFG